MATLIPALAASQKSAEPEIAKAQEQMAATFSAEQEKSALAKQALAELLASGAEVQLHIYKNRLPSCHYVFKDGSQATFVKGVYKTANSVEIEQLDKEVRSGHPHIFIDKNEPAVISSTDDADPMAALRAKIRAEILAENTPRDLGNNLDPADKKLNVAGTDQVAQNVSNGAAALMPAALLAAMSKNS
jgi:hypothetical protein